MCKVSKKNITIIILVTCIAGVTGLNLWKASLRPTPAKSVAARAKGDAKAAVHIVEFVDFQCGFCAIGAKYVDELYEKNPQKIRYELKYFPLKNHLHGRIATRYAECAAQQGKFWPAEKYLFENQSQWSPLIDPKPAFEKMVQEIKLDKERLASCLENKVIEDIIQKDIDEGVGMEVKSTPTFFVNGKMSVGVKSLEQDVMPLLKEKKD